MDFLNKAFGQVSELFRSMTPGARITAGLLLALVVVSVGYLFNHQMSGGDAYLLDGQHFTTAELQAMQGAFGQANLGNFEIEAGRVRVPRGLKAKYMAALADAGALPSHFGSFLDAAVNKPSPFTSKEQQQAMLKTALQKELASWIGNMNGVETAAVFYDVQKRGGLRSETTVTASVSVKPRGPAALPTDQVPKIRALVAGAIGASPDQITVVDVNGPTYKGGKNDVPDILDDPYAQRVKYWQNDYERKILQALEYVPGVVVTAHVELDPRTLLQEENTKVDPKTVPIHVKEETETNQTDAAGPSGQPGLQAQQRPNTAATLPATARGNHTEKEHTSRTEQNDASRIYTRMETAPLTPKRVSVTVGVPSTYFETVYRQLNPTPPGQTPVPIDSKKLDQVQKDATDRIKAHVANLLPQTDATADARPMVTVDTFPQLKADAPAGPGTGAVVVDWLLANWSTVGMSGLALFSLVMLRSMVRSAPAITATPDLPLPPAPPPTSATETKKDTGEPAEKRSGRLKRRLGTGQSLRDELAEMVREDPDTAASILRTWIGSAN